jgi:hypothetical protein
VTFTYDRYSRYEVPVNPIIQRIRSDVSWEDVQRDSEENLPQTQVLNGKGGERLGRGRGEEGDWEEGEKEKNDTCLPLQLFRLFKQSGW